MTRNVPPRGRSEKLTYLRLLILLACVSFLGATLFPGFGPASARVQQRARRAITSPSKSPTSRKQTPPIRRSRNAQVLSQGRMNADGSIIPDQLLTDQPIQRTTAQIMAAQEERGTTTRTIQKPEFEIEEKEDRPEGQPALEAPQWPAPPESQKSIRPITTEAPQTLGTQFDGATGPTETGAFPPDTMGAVGPTQVVVFLNGRLRTFNKTTGVADAAINADSDVFFASVVTPPGAGEVSFTSDPQVRFDRLSNRWFMVIIDVTLNASTGAVTKANRVLIAVNDAASNGTITGATVWTFYQFQGDATLFTDYESLGVDANALYVGGDMFTLPGAFQSTKGFVIPKAPLLTGSPATVWAFTGLVATPTGAGPFAPRGTDNYDPTNTGPTAVGYFIGVDNATFNTLMIRRVTNPGSLGPAPTISANISVATPLTTRFPVLVPHLGNTGGTGGRLDALDDRLYAAHLRNGRLWTAHNIGVNNSGVAGAVNNRNAARWYELQNLSTTPAVLQSGTLFDNNVPNDANQRNYWIPSIMVSGQGHVALGCSIAGTNERINAFTTGRLSGDTLGTLRDGPGGAALPGYTASSTAYNPPGDPGGPSRRWGDYSFTSLDPKDDMTMWTIQEYCNGTNTYGVRAVKLIAPPPATPTSVTTGEVVPGTVPQARPAYIIKVNGTALAGSGFYDPGPDGAPPATPFNHVNVTINGAGAPTVTPGSITFGSPTQLTMTISTVGAALGSYTITVTNPDGQQVTSATPIITVIGPTAAPATISGRITLADGAPLPGVSMRLQGAISASTISDSNGNYRFANVESENFYTVTPSLVNYRFSPSNLAFSLLGNKSDAMFTAAPDSVIRGNVIDSSDFFVRQQYLDFLGREPDQGGFDYWTLEMAACNGDAACMNLRRIDVSAAFFAAREFQDTGSYVFKLYKSALGRQVRFAEFSTDRQQVVAGPNLDQSKTAFANAFVQRAEFVQKYAANTNAASFVDALLQTLHDTNGTDLFSERNNLISRYNGAPSLVEARALVVRDLADHPALTQAVYNQSFVLMQYFGYLRRDPDQGGYDFWLGLLNGREAGNYRGMVCAFITSAEYQRRFGGMITRSNAVCGDQ